MRPLSATEAFTPALEHTKAMLRPFSLKLWLKLCGLACLAEMGMQFAFPSIGNLGAPTSSQPAGTTSGSEHLMLLIAIIGGLAFLVFAALFYVSSRMQFVLMELVARRTKLVRPAWHKSAAKTWRWIGIKLTCFTASFAIIAAIVGLPVFYFLRSIPSQGAPQPTAAFFGGFFLMFAGILFAVFAMLLVMWVLRDLILPFILFEDATFGEAFRSAYVLIRKEVAGVSFYFLMKLAFSMAAGIAAELCILAGLLIIALPSGLIGGGIWLALHKSGPAGVMLMYVGLGLVGAAAFIAFLIVIICAIGATLIFYQAYALYFLGGRISRIGDLLEPPPPPFVDTSTPLSAPA